MRRDVGIGTVSPTTKLDVNGSALFSGSVGIGTASPYHRLAVYAPGEAYVPNALYPGIDYKAQISVTAEDVVDRVAGIRFGHNNGRSDSLIGVVKTAVGGDMVFQSRTQTTYNPDKYDVFEKMRITSVGNVGIGTASPTTKLDVAGTIKAEAVNVPIPGWPDFVFEKNYKIKALSDVEKYIQKYQHLEGIPSEKTLKKEGLSLGGMQKMQMTKIEELFLYSIAQDKEIKRLKSENEMLKKRLDKIESSLLLMSGSKNQQKK